MVDGLGFRYYWATEGLRESDYSFQPSNDSMTVKELLHHINGLVGLTNHTVGGERPQRHDFETLREVRSHTLTLISEVRTRLGDMDDVTLHGCKVYLASRDQEYPIWNIINGPLSDALTHVGQLNSWRRLNGNPVSRANVFTGTPPS
jgi:hypothetical protein